MLDGTQVAVKRPYEGGKEKDHISRDLKTHAQINHPYILPLLGYSFFDNQHHIVYELMTNGSLFQLLHESQHAGVGSSTILTWRQRFTIAHQTVQVLSYLHNDSNPRVFHVDVKSENILLDDNLNAKLSDFGHSQTIEPGQSYISMAAEGTPHLIDPYWRRSGQLTDKTDVYCFGILLVELLSTQKAKDLKRGDDGAILQVKKGELVDAFDPSLKVGASEVASTQMKELASLAVDCLSKHIRDRPTMKQVEEEIERIGKL